MSIFFVLAIIFGGAALSLGLFVMWISGGDPWH